MGERVNRVTIDEGGPIMVEGPVELDLPDGTRVRSDRPVVAVCACRRSKRYPFCDTSHRRKERRTGPAQAAERSGAATSADSPAVQQRTT
jgi:CDGSH-type Zn-finger protein